MVNTRFTCAGDKRISFEEFLPVLKSGAQKKPEGSEQDFIEGLRVFDKDANSTISAAGTTAIVHASFSSI